MQVNCSLRLDVRRFVWQQVAVWEDRERHQLVFEGVLFYMRNLLFMHRRAWTMFSHNTSLSWPKFWCVSFFAICLRQFVQDGVIKQRLKVTNFPFLDAGNIKECAACFCSPAYMSNVCSKYPQIFVFIIGGVTYEEALLADQLSNRFCTFFFQLFIIYYLLNKFLLICSFCFLSPDANVKVILGGSFVHNSHSCAFLCIPLSFFAAQVHQ